MSLEASIASAVGSLALDVELSIDEEVVALLGPNGAGKTSLLKALAGITPIDSGRIVLDGRVLDDPAGGIFVPPKDRRIGMVFQDYLLFPFLSARENVEFGLRSRRVGRREARDRANRWLDRLGISQHASDRPGQLSGGQAQRVALARAVVGDPAMLLLDEPLAALDAGTHLEVRRELREYLKELPGARLIVTHDPVDASALADRVVILEAGRIVQVGSMAEIALHPRSSYVANLVGLNLLRGIADDGVVRLAGGGNVVIASRSARGEVCVAIHPRSVSLHIAEVSGSARNRWRGTVTDIDNLGERIRVEISGEFLIVAEITPGAASELALALGSDVIAEVKATEIEVYPV